LKRYLVFESTIIITIIDLHMCIRLNVIRFYII